MIKLILLCFISLSIECAFANGNEDQGRLTVISEAFHLQTLQPGARDTELLGILMSRYGVSSKKDLFNKILDQRDQVIQNSRVAELVAMVNGLREEELGFTFTVSIANYEYILQTQIADSSGTYIYTIELVAPLTGPIRVWRHTRESMRVRNIDYSPAIVTNG